MLARPLPTAVGGTPNVPEIPLQTAAIARWRCGRDDDLSANQNLAEAAAMMRERSQIIREVLVALLVVSVAWAARGLLAAILEVHFAFITFFPAMFVLASWGGLRPTAIGLAFSLLPLGSALWAPDPDYNFSQTQYQVAFALYAAFSLAAGGLGNKALVAKQQAVQATEAALNEGKQLRVNVAIRKRAEEALTFLASASTSLAALVDRESALQQAARLPIPFLADWCVVYVVDGKGGIDYHAHAHINPVQDRMLGEMLTKFPLDWDSNTATVRALRTGKPQLMEELPEPLLSSFTQSEEHRFMVDELSPHAVISVPLKIRERTIGVIGLVACDPKRRYTQREVALAESLAQRVAIAVDNARLFHAVKEASRQKDEFLAMLAHELRNPLAAIRYAVELGSMSPKDASAELFGIIDRQTGNLAHLIDDLLDVSRISRDKVTLRRENSDLAALVGGAAATVRPLLEEKQHELKLEIPDQPVLLYVDPTRAEQILANLLTNAAKYTNKGGRITVRARTEGREAVIEVRDTGIGLPRELLSRVFDLFAQADRTLDRSEGGLGIGLTVSRKLAEMHGGTISADSPGLGQGSTFTVRLPLAQSFASASESDSEGRQPHDEPRKILVVDDNRDTASSCALMFKTLGHDVQTAYDGLAALDVARTFRPEAIFLDIGLPGMNGFDVVRSLREEGFKDELIVAVSGYGQPEDRQRSQDAGFDEHLVKPVHRDALLAALRRVSNKRAMAT